jgi:hypothetical protein
MSVPPLGRYHFDFSDDAGLVRLRGLRLKHVLEAVALVVFERFELGMNLDPSSSVALSTSRLTISFNRHLTRSPVPPTYSVSSARPSSRARVKADSKLSLRNKNTESLAFSLPVVSSKTTNRNFAAYQL